MSFFATRISRVYARTHSRIHKICIKDIMFHGRNNLAHGPHNPGDFLTAVLPIARFVTASICKIVFFDWARARS